MKLLENFFEKLYNTIKYNGLYIILSILFPIMFYSLDAGKEIILFLLNPEQQYNITLTAFSFFLISLSIWCIPVLAIDFFEFITNYKINKEEIFEKIDGNYNGFQEETVNKNTNNTIPPQIPVKYLASLPWIIFLSTLFVIIYSRKPFFIVGLLFCIFTFVIINIFFDKKSDEIIAYYKIQEKRKWNFLYLSFVFLILYLLMPMFFENAQKFGSLLILYYYLGFGFLYTFIVLFDIIRKIKVDNLTSDFSYRSSKITHIAVIVSVSILLVIFYIYNRNADLGKFSPIVVSVIISCLLILGIEFFVSSQNLIIKIVDEKDLKLKFYKFAIVLATIGLLSSYFFSSYNQHLIRKEEIGNYNRSDYDRLNLEEYFQKWYDEKKKNLKETDTLTVYLISGQGGGSRAGAWFLMNMMFMDAKNKEFYDHIFSISTVSGSSSGANMYLALHQMEQYNQLRKDSIGKNEANKIKLFTENIYSRNYLSSGVFGLILNDFTLDALTNRLNNERRDRNYTLQKEELKAFEESYFEMFPALDKSDLSSKTEKIRKYFEGDFLSIYKNNYTNPLFFINTTIINDGTKGIFSPVKTSSFSMFRDVYGDYRSCSASDNYALPMVTCVNQSQAFPVVNAYSYLHGSGRLGDGGMYENSGTETTLEIYKALINYINRLYNDNDKSNDMKNIRFVFINLMNSKLSGRLNNDFTKASYLNTISAMAKNPFYGHEYTSYKSLQKVIDEKNFISITPKNQYSLTRMLSTSTIDSLFENILNNYKTVNNNVFITAKTANSDNIQSKISAKEAKIFIQYSSSDNLVKKIEEILNDNYNVQPLDFVPLKNPKNSIRYFHEEDKTIAEKIKNKIETQSESKNFEIIYLGDTYKFVPKQQIEVWLGR